MKTLTSSNNIKSSISLSIEWKVNTWFFLFSVCNRFQVTRKVKKKLNFFNSTLEIKFSIYKKNWTCHHRKQMKTFFSANNTPSIWLKILQNFPWSSRIYEKFFPSLTKLMFQSYALYDVSIFLEICSYAIVYKFRGLPIAGRFSEHLFLGLLPQGDMSNTEKKSF